MFAMDYIPLKSWFKAWKKQSLSLYRYWFKVKPHIVISELFCWLALYYLFSFVIIFFRFFSFLIILTLRFAHSSSFVPWTSRASHKEYQSRSVEKSKLCPKRQKACFRKIKMSNKNANVIYEITVLKNSQSEKLKCPKNLPILFETLKFPKKLPLLSETLNCPRYLQ